MVVFPQPPSGCHVMNWDKIGHYGEVITNEITPTGDEIIN